jgi:hypothetical protein
VDTVIVYIACCFGYGITRGVKGDACSGSGERCKIRALHMQGLGQVTSTLSAVLN